MGAPVASGTLAGSPSDSEASIHREPPAATSPAPSTPSGPTTRTTLPTVAESNVVVGHDFRDRETDGEKIDVTNVTRFDRTGSGLGAERLAASPGERRSGALADRCGSLRQQAGRGYRAIAPKRACRPVPPEDPTVDHGDGLASGDYVRLLSDRNRRPRTGSGGSPARRYVRSSTTSTTSRRRSSCPRPKTDPQHTVDAGVVPGHTRSCRLPGVWSTIERAPSDLSCRPRARLPGPLSSLKDARAADFLSPVAPLTFQPGAADLCRFCRTS